MVKEEGREQERVLNLDALCEYLQLNHLELGSQSLVRLQMWIIIFSVEEQANYFLGSNSIWQSVQIVIMTLMFSMLRERKRDVWHCSSGTALFWVKGNSTVWLNTLIWGRKKKLEGEIKEKENVRTNKKKFSIVI